MRSKILCLIVKYWLRILQVDEEELVMTNKAVLWIKKIPNLEVGQRNWVKN
jgi:hypothetical protein